MATMGADTSMLDRSGLVREFFEGFIGPGLDRNIWIDHYLPHWTTPERSAAHYDLGDGGLRLRIHADQPTWREEDEPLRASGLQTGIFSGPLGSSRGQSRHRPDLTVRTPQPTRHLYTPSGGVVEATLRAVADPTIMLAFWLVGVEDRSPEDSGEICVAELFGDAIGADGSEIRTGIKAHDDPRLHDDMVRPRLDLDATDWHRYAAEWDREEVRIFVDDRLVHRSRQAITYPLALKLDLFEFPVTDQRDPASYPKVGGVGEVVGYRRIGG